jgi:hypothetical protein
VSRVRRGAISQTVTRALENLSMVKLPIAAAMILMLVIVEEDVGSKERSIRRLRFVAFSDGDARG